MFNIKNNSNIRIKKVTNFVFILVLCLHTIQAQDTTFTQREVDSFITKPLTPEKLLEFERMLRSNESLVGWVRYNSRKAYLHISRKPDNDSAIYYANTAIDLFKKNQPKSQLEEKSLLNAYFVLTRVHYLSKQYEQSIINAQAFLEIEKKYPTKLRAYIIGLIAASHLAQGNDSLALSYYKQNAKDTDYMKNNRSRITTLTRIGILYTKDYLNVIDSAKTYLNMALVKSRQSSYKNNLSPIYDNLGDIYKEEGLVDSAVYCYSRSYELLKNHKPLDKEAARMSQLYNNINYGYVKFYQGKVAEAEQLLEKTMDSIKDTWQDDKNMRDLFLSATENLQLVYKKQGNYKKLVDLLEKKIIVLDGFSEAQQNQKIEELEISYQTRQKQHEIETLTVEKEHAQFKSQQRLIILIVSLLSFVTLLVIIHVLFRNKRLKDKYRKVSLEQQLLRTQMTPHFLFNALNNITVLYKKTPDQLDDFVIRLSKLLRLTLDNSRSDFVALEDEIRALDNYLTVQSSIYSELTYSIEIENTIETDIVLVPPMLIQPLVENAIFHGILKKMGAGNLTVKLYRSGEEGNTNLICEVLDDGIGISISRVEKDNILNHQSMSMQVMDNRLKIYGNILKKHYTIEAKDIVIEQKIVGTKATLELPHYFL